MNMISRHLAPSEISASPFEAEAVAAGWLPFFSLFPTNRSKSKHHAWLVHRGTFSVLEKPQHGKEKVKRIVHMPISFQSKPCLLPSLSKHGKPHLRNSEAQKRNIITKKVLKNAKKIHANTIRFFTW